MGTENIFMLKEDITNNGDSKSNVFLSFLKELSEIQHPIFCKNDVTFKQYYSKYFVIHLSYNYLTNYDGADPPMPTYLRISSGLLALIFSPSGSIEKLKKS